MDELNLDYVRGRVVLVTGAAGTIGSALVQQLLPIAKAVRCLDHSETELFFLHQRLQAVGQMAPQLGDIRDLDRLRFSMNGVDVVFHTAALKHVGLAEYNPEWPNWFEQAAAQIRVALGPSVARRRLLVLAAAILLALVAALATYWRSTAPEQSVRESAG